MRGRVRGTLASMTSGRGRTERRLWLAMSLGLGCHAAPPVPSDTGVASTSGTTGGGSTSMGSTASTTREGGTSSSSADTIDSAGFIRDPDGSNPNYECDQFAQDCPAGSKCAPSSSDGYQYDGTHCVPIARDPGAIGEPCTADDAMSGLDDCELGAVCWFDDAAAREGTCIGLCIGSAADPGCADPCAQCIISGAISVLLCIPGCDPIAQDCRPGRGCYPSDDGDFFFFCYPDTSGELGAIGDPCSGYVNTCDPGNMCAPAELVPGCDDPQGCCTSWCDAGAPDPCDAIVPGTTCVTYDDPPRPPNACVGASVGICIAP